MKPFTIDQLPPALRAQLDGRGASSRPAPAPRANKFGNAKRVTIHGITFASQAEGVAYIMLRAEHGDRLRCHPRFPLLSLAPTENGRCLYFTPDFVVVDQGKIGRVFESKPRDASMRSRDYEIRRRAFEATYGVKVEELLQN